MNDLQRRNGPIKEFGKPALQLITAYSSVELIDQKSASITHTHGHDDLISDHEIFVD